RQLDRKRARQTLHRGADASRHGPARARSLPGDAGGKDNRSAVADTATAVFGGEISTPVAQSEKTPRRVDIGSRQTIELQALTGGEDEMVEATDVSEQRPHRRLVGKISRMALDAFRQRPQRVVHSRLPARSDDH